MERQAHLSGIPVLAGERGEYDMNAIPSFYIIIHYLDATKLDKKNYTTVFEILTKHQGVIFSIY